MPMPRPALLEELLPGNARLFVVSNRGPITFDCAPATGRARRVNDDDRPRLDPAALTASRGSGGLVTALAELGR